MTASRRVARYIRVSRTDQDPSLQLDETARLIAARGWDLVDTYTDHGISGSRDHRPELDRMLKDARQGRFNTVLPHGAPSGYVDFALDEVLGPTSTRVLVPIGG